MKTREMAALERLDYLVQYSAILICLICGLYVFSDNIAIACSITVFISIVVATLYCLWKSSDDGWRIKQWG